MKPNQLKIQEMVLIVGKLTILQSQFHLLAWGKIVGDGFDKDFKKMNM